METKGLTATILFEAQSLNYDEGYGNLSVIKKLHRGSGEVFTYASRQSLRYSIFMQGVRECGWKPSDVEEAGSGEQTVTQLVSEIDQSEEGDLFGYMRTNVKVYKGKAVTKDEIERQKIKKEDVKEVSVLRTTPVRLLPAIALEPFSSDLEMLTNKYQADKKQLSPNIANMEVHRSLYRYTIAIDLHRIGTEGDQIGTRISPGKSTQPQDYAQYETWLRSIDLKKDDKAKRVNQFLDVIKTLFRDIKGRREDLKPLFIVGGVYGTCNPFFENLVELEWKDGKPRIVPEPLIEILSSSYSTVGSNGELIKATIKDESVLGIRSGKFSNTKKDFSSNNGSKAQEESAIIELLSPEKAIESLQAKVNQYYGVEDKPSE